MKTRQLHIRVYPSAAATKALLDRVVTVHPSVSIPYDSLLSNFEFLFGSTIRVEFQFL